MYFINQSLYHLFDVKKTPVDIDLIPIGLIKDDATGVYSLPGLDGSCSSAHRPGGGYIQ